MRNAIFLVFSIVAFSGASIQQGSCQVQDIACLKLGPLTSCQKEHGIRPGDMVGVAKNCVAILCQATVPPQCPPAHTLEAGKWTEYVSAPIWKTSIPSYEIPIAPQNGFQHTYTVPWVCKIEKNCHQLCEYIIQRPGYPTGHYCRTSENYKSLPMYGVILDSNNNPIPCPGMIGPPTP